MTAMNTFLMIVTICALLWVRVERRRRLRLAAVVVKLQRQAMRSRREKDGPS